MKLIVGLGNPGDKYKNNRHNVGFMFLDFLLKINSSDLIFKNNKYLLSDICELAKNIQPPISDLILAKPTTFMNKSGVAVKKIIENFELKNEDLFVIHDDLDIPLGKFQIRSGVGPQLHNGIDSIEQHLKTKDFLRIRIGVDNRDPQKRISGEAYVLSDFNSAEFKILNNEVFPKILLQLKLLHKIY